MSVIRKHKKEKDYFTAKNAALKDKNLSFKAKGLWAYAMSLPDDWDFNVEHLKTVSADGEDAVYSTIKELIRAGYCYKHQPNNGRFGKVEYIIFETLEDAEEFKKSLPLRDFPDAQASVPKKAGLLSIKEEQSTKEEVVCYPPPKKGDDLSKEVIKEALGGKKIECRLDEVYRYAVNKNLDWSAEEIREAWQILVEYKGYIRDFVYFISGTIRNLRTKKRSEFLAKDQKKEEKKSCIPHSAKVPPKQEELVNLGEYLKKHWDS